MKTIKLSLLGLFLMSFTMLMGQGNVDVSKSSVSWKGYKVLGSHTGNIDISKAKVMYDESGMLIGGSFVLDMSSISNTDMDGEMKGKLEGHLKSDDFFGVEKHPKATLEITKVTSRGQEGQYKVLANLTIKGITKPVKFNALVSNKEGMKVTEAKIVVDRSEYDVRYGSGSFFDNLGDNTIYDEFDVNVRLVTM